MKIHGKLPDAVCVVIMRDGAVLSISRRDDPTAYGLPGGKVEKNETPESAAVRELHEETGISVTEQSLTHVYDALEESGKFVRTYLAPDPGTAFKQQGEGVVIWAGWPSLMNGPYGRYNKAVREALSELPEQWSLIWGSGTLRRAIEEGLAWRELYLHERVAFEIGYGFQAAQKSRLTLGKALGEGDSPSTTETCWWARALRWRSKRDNRDAEVKVVHARLDDGDGGASEGIAITYETIVPLSWLPQDRILVAFTTVQGRTVNPC